MQNILIRRKLKTTELIIHQEPFALLSYELFCSVSVLPLQYRTLLNVFFQAGPPRWVDCLAPKREMS